RRYQEEGILFQIRRALGLPRLEQTVLKPITPIRIGRVPVRYTLTPLFNSLRLNLLPRGLPCGQQCLVLGDPSVYFFLLLGALGQALLTSLLVERDVVVWLRSLGLGKSEAIFRDNDIDEAVLPSLTHENLKELGVVPKVGSFAARLQFRDAAL